MVFVEGSETYFHLFIPFSDEPLIDTTSMTCKIVNISSCCCHGYYYMVFWGPVKACVWAWMPQKVDLLCLLLSNNKKRNIQNSAYTPSHIQSLHKAGRLSNRAGSAEWQWRGQPTVGKTTIGLCPLSKYRHKLWEAAYQPWNVDAG